MKARVVLSVLGVVVAQSVAGLGFASPAAAQVTPGTGYLMGGAVINGGTVAGVSTSNGTLPTFDNSVAGVTTIHLTTPQTIIYMGDQYNPGFNLPAGNTLNFRFVNSTDTVLLRTVNGVASVNGNLNSFVGPTGSSAGGNAWLSSASGATFGSGTRVNVGGLLATTADIAGQDFFNGSYRFANAPSGTEVQVNGTAQITGSDSPVAFIAPKVTTDAAATVSGGADAEVLYGSAQQYELSLSPNFMQPGLDVQRLDVPSHQAYAPNRGGMMNLNATTTAGDIYVASAAKDPNGSGLINAGRLNASGYAASGKGNLVLSGGGGLTRTANVIQPIRQQGAAAHDIQIDNFLGYGVQAASGIRALASGRITVNRPVTSPQNVRLVAGGDLAVKDQAQVSGSTVALSTGARFLNGRGADAIGSNNWTVHSADPANNTFGGLNSGSGQTARWNAGTLPNEAPSGKRYLFSTSPTLTFSSRDLTKKFGEDAASDLAAPDALGVRYDVAGLHQGVSGVFAADTTTTAFSGAPALSSPGAGTTASVLRGPYPINLAQGTLASPAGYGFAFVPAGRLRRTPAELVPPTVSLFQPLGAGSGGWYKTSAKAQVNAGDNSEVDSLDCTVDGSPATIEDTASGPRAQSGSVTVTGNGEHLISCRATDGSGNAKTTSGPLKVDAAAPSLSADCPATAVRGTPAQATIAASDGESGLARDPSGTQAIDTGALGPQTVTATATDNVGFTTTRSCTTTVVAATQNPGDVAAPGLAGLKLSPSAFKAASAGGSIGAAGAKLTFKLSEPAAVAFTVERKAAGRKSGGTCVAPKPSNKKAKVCARYVRVTGTFSVSGKTGANSARFTGRVGGRKLSRGNYRLAAEAKDAAGNASALRRHPFRIR